jgi:hypothetical protein
VYGENVDFYEATCGPKSVSKMLSNLG